MIVPFSTMIDLVNGGLLLVYRSDGERRSMRITPEQNMRWKRWIKRMRTL